MSDKHQKNVRDLCKALLVLETEKEAFNFLKDLCTPAELHALAERWQICKCLHEGLSYREIHAEIGASLTTIGRVARFLKDEPYQGYVGLLQRLKVNKERVVQ
jgi:TrpR-related protein YerC/YecD